MEAGKLPDLREVLAQARARLGWLAGRYAEARSDEKEALHAELEFERWLVESCEEAYDTEP
jgi:hypothetical protein